MPKWVLADDVGIETLGGVFTRVIEKGTELPCEASQVFSTAEDGQAVVTIRLVQGRNDTAAQNRKIGTFDLGGIAPAPRGVPQIEVTFRIDGDGNLSVSACDLATRATKAMSVAATEEARIKLHDALSDIRLVEPLHLAGPDGKAAIFIDKGEYLPAFKRLRVTTSEAAQTRLPVKFYGAFGRTLAEKTFGLKGNASAAGSLMDLNLDVAVTPEGAIELWRRSKDGKLGDCLFTSTKRLAVTRPGEGPDEAGPVPDKDTGKDPGKGAAGATPDAAGIFDDIFGKVFGSDKKPIRPGGAYARKPEDPAPSPAAPDAGTGTGFGAAARPQDPPNAARIFVSHASGDAQVANEVVQSLETTGGRACWIAPRDVRAGHDYRSEILSSIKACSHFILLMSDAANTSPHVLREVSLADQYSKRIILIKLSDVILRPELEYLLHGRHWVRWEETRSTLERLL